MLTKNQYIISLFLSCAIFMIFGAGIGHFFPEAPLDALYAENEAELYLRDEFDDRPLHILFQGCLPHIRWMAFLFFCGFCAFCGPMTVLCTGVSAFLLGHSFALWHLGRLPLLCSLLLGLCAVSCVLLSYCSFSFWGILRDGHIRRVYRVDNAVLCRLCLRFFKLGGSVLLIRILLIIFSLSFTK
ncbi:MAG: hypothetical protein IJY12_02875 [Clostridia bacterium]|nr:hypothetical protein [Clostridia bacterium]